MSEISGWSLLWYKSDKYVVASLLQHCYDG